MARHKRPLCPKNITRESLLEVYNFNYDTGMWTDKSGERVIAIKNNKPHLCFADKAISIAIINWFMYHGEFIDYARTLVCVRSKNGGYSKNDLERYVVERGVKRTTPKRNFETVKNTLQFMFYSALNQARLCEEI